MKQKEKLVSSSLVESKKDSEKVAQGGKLKETEGIISISFNQLHEFKGHPFRVENDMELFELMRSIEKEGVIVPALAIFVIFENVLLRYILCDRIYPLANSRKFANGYGAAKCGTIK